jgi:hypothetical protein
MVRSMRTSFCSAAAALALFALPAWADAHCSAMDPNNEIVAMVSVPGDFKACVTKLLTAAKTRCAPKGPELKLTVTGNENGKDADLRVLRVDCGGPTTAQPLPPHKK